VALHRPKMMRSPRLITLLVSTCVAQIEFTGVAHTAPVFCAEDRQVYPFRVPRHGVLFESCPSWTSPLSLFALDKFMLLTFLGSLGAIPAAAVPPIAETVDPCDYSTYHDPSYIRGKVGIFFEIVELICLYGKGERSDLLGYPDRTWTSAGIRSLTWLEDNGVVGLIFVATSHPSWMNGQPGWGTELASGISFPQMVLVHDEAFIPSVIVAQTFFDLTGGNAGAQMYVASMIPGLPETAELSRHYTKTANSVGLVISYYVVAFPWSVVVIVYSIYMLYKQRRNFMKPTYISIFLEGCLAGVMRMCEIIYVAPGCFLNASFFHSLTVYLDELTPVASACSSLFAFLVFLRVVEPKIQSLLTDRVAMVIGVVVSLAFGITMIFMTSLYDRAIYGLQAEDIADLIALLNRLEAQIEPPLVGVSAGILSLYFLMAAFLAYKVFSVASSGVSDKQKNKSMGRLLFWIMVQLVGGLIGVAGSILGISTQIATASAEGVSATGGVLDPVLSSIAEESTGKLLMSFGLKTYGYLLMGTAQLLALDQSSPSSSSSSSSSSTAAAAATTTRVHSYTPTTTPPPHQETG